VLFEASAPAIDVAQMIERTARDVLDKFGIDGYKKRWIEYPFPLADLDDLYAAIEDERRRLA
jgi:hypothetical protein